jgi:hypothetical protein
MRTLQIGLAVIFVAWLIASYVPLPSAKRSNGLFIHDKGLNFMWLLPEGWFQVEPLTGADYALNLRNDKSVSLVLDTWEESHDDAHSLTEKLRDNPSFLFDGGIKPRFPVSRFLGSSVATVNSRPAIQSECEFVTLLGNQRVNWFGGQVVTIHDNTAYNFVLECPVEKRERATRLMKEALARFILVKNGSLTYVSPSTSKYKIQVPASTVMNKVFLDEIMAWVSEHENAIDQHMISAVLNSFIQGMVLPFAEVPEKVGRFLHSPERVWDCGARELLVGTEFNFPVSTDLRRSIAVRTARYVPSVTYVALIFLLIYRKRNKAKVDQGAPKAKT